MAEIFIVPCRLAPQQQKKKRQIGMRKGRGRGWTDKRVSIRAKGNAYVFLFYFSLLC